MSTPPPKENRRVRRLDNGREFSVSYLHQYRRCGKDCKKCRDGKRHGPYWYAQWKEAGKVKNRYIGKEFKELWKFAGFKKA